MLSYRIDRSGALVPAAGEHAALCLMTTEEFQLAQDYPRHRQMLHGLGSIRYSKAEVYAGCVQGLLRIPQKREERESHLALGFYLERDRLTFIESAGRLKELPAMLRDRLTEPVSPDRLLLLCLELMSDEDVFYLQHIEEKMDGLEEEILADRGEKVFEALMDCRKKLSDLNAYYEQMSYLGELMASEAGSVVSSPGAWESYVHKMERLQRYVALLREYAAQLREVYQAQLDARQNRVMSILTVVTTIFLPLTLLTGWYGMNFANMPELRWRWGYPVVMAAAAVIVVAEIVYFKKKKML